MKTKFHLLLFLALLGMLAMVAPPQPPPSTNLEAEFSATATSGCAGIRIQFFNQSSGNIGTPQWTFPGGIPESSQAEDPFVTFPDSGNFQVLLEVSDGTLTAVDSVNIMIQNPEPQVAFSFENNGLVVDFSNSSSGTDNYLWEFGDHNFSTEYSPQHTYDKEGVYIVRLRATNDCKAVIKSEIVILNSTLQPVNYTANDIVKPYDGPFRPGVNLGYFPPWTDATLADIAAGNPDKGVRGAGIKAIRPGLFEHFLEEYGYDIRDATFRHYDSLGLEDNTVIIGFPSEAHRDTNYYCSDEQSELFANMYTSIWDNGENGTPVNDTNYYALYLWKMVNLYKEEIRFWEIWNEPGFDYTFVTGYLPPGTPNNWWDNNPDPCDYKLRAPIFHYIRLLRISYEIIKALDPDSYVTLASVGFPAFMDAILRNTDNPDDGSIDGDFPLQGGAYFDAVGIHSYPHFDGTLRRWDDNIQDFIYFRHTDKAITSISTAKDTFEFLLDQYGYDGLQYPKKEWIITETNLPRKSFSAESYGSEEVQINFVLKAYVESVRNDIRQMHVYDMSESHTLETAISEFQLMGLYKVLFGIFPYGQEINNLGIAYRGIAELLYGATYDADRTAALQLAEGLDGAAFLDRNGHYHYVLWAKTSEDLSEAASGTFSFPNNWNVTTLQKRSWDYTESNVVENISSQAIALQGEPIFLSDTSNTFLVLPTADFRYDITDNCIPTTVQYFETASTNVTGWNWTFPGGQPSTSSDRNPIITYEQPGTYDATLEVSNAAGSNSESKNDLFVVDDTPPTAAFSSETFDRMVSFNNHSQNATSYRWDLGDNNVSSEANPDHNYPVPGIFEVVLLAINGCDTAVATQTIIINPEQINPLPNFSASVQAGCPGLTVQYFNQSSVNATDFFWLFLNGDPSFSTEENPIVRYDKIGQHAVSLQASNVAGSLAIFKDSFILIEEAPIANFELMQSDATVTCSNLSTGAWGFIWDFGDGNSSSDFNPVHTYTEGGNFDVLLRAYNSCDTVQMALEVFIEAIPSAEMSILPERGCVPLEVQFGDQSSGQVLARQWAFPGGNPSQSIDANPLVQYTEVGQYTATLIVGNATGNDTLVWEEAVEVLPFPVADFDYTLQSAEVQFRNNSQYADANNWQWDFGDGNSSSARDPLHTYSSGGNYLVQLIVSNECGQDTLEQEISILIDGVNVVEETWAIQVLPNPNRGQFSIVVEGAPAGDLDWTVFDILGREMFRERLDLNAGYSSKAYDFEDWPSGAYFLRWSDGVRSFYRKMILE